MGEVDEVITAFGEEVGFSGLEFDANGHCNLGIDEKFDVQLFADREKEIITAFSLVATLPDKDCSDIYQKLLQANLFWMGTGGATLSLEVTTRSVFLARTIPTEGLTPKRFKRFFETFTDSVEHWQEEIGMLVDKMETVLPSTNKGQPPLRL